MKFLKSRKFQVEILIALLFFMGSSCAIIISVSYSAIAQSTLKEAKQIIEQTAATVIEKINDLTTITEQLPVLVADFCENKNPVATKNPVLEQFLLNAVKQIDEVYSLYIATTEGDFMGAFEIPVKNNRVYSVVSGKELPGNVRYALVLSSTTAGEKWLYKDEQLNDVVIESFPKETLRDKNRPWYKAAEKNRKLSWSGIYLFADFNEYGTAASLPLFDKEGHMTYIIGVSVSLQFLSEFMQNQELGKNGKVFVLDKEGKVVLPINHERDQAPIPTLFADLFRKGENSFVMKANGIAYIFSFKKIFAFSDDYWYIVSTAPMADFFSTLVLAERRSYIISFVILLIAAVFAYYFAKKVSVPITRLAYEIDKIKQLDFSSNLRVESHNQEIIMMDSSIYSMKIALQSFAKYVPKKIIEELIREGKTISLGGEKQTLTIFFSDIDNFTALGQQFPTEMLLDLLAKYFDGLSKIILSNMGTIDKYMGDGIMAFWGAPHELHDHGKKSCICALLCKKFIIDFNQEEQFKHLPVFPTRIGIHTGEAIVGNVGTNDRMNYTIIGDAVNTAARLQEANKVYHTTILVSEDTLQGCRDLFLVRALESAAMRGKQNRIKIYELLDRKEDPIFPSTYERNRVICDLFNKAYDLFERKEYMLAKHLFEDIIRLFPDDYPSSFYLKKIVDLERTEIS